jgi:hypothetical protein
VIFAPNNAKSTFLGAPEESDRGGETAHFSLRLQMIRNPLLALLLVAALLLTAALCIVFA